MREQLKCLMFLNGNIWHESDRTMLGSHSRKLASTKLGHRGVCFEVSLHFCQRISSHLSKPHVELKTFGWLDIISKCANLLHDFWLLFYFFEDKPGSKNVVFAYIRSVHNQQLQQITFIKTDIKKSGIYALKRKM